MKSDVKDRIDAFFKKEEENLSKLFDQLTLFVYSQESKDLYYLAKILDYNSLIRIIDYYNGGEIKLPSKEEFRKFYLTAVCYFLKEERNWDWTTIKNYLKIDEEDEYFSSISIGKKINEIKEHLSTDLVRLLKTVKSDDIEKLVKEIGLWQTQKTKTP